MTVEQAAKFLIEELPGRVRRAVLENDHEQTMTHGIPGAGIRHGVGKGDIEKVSAVANRIALQLFSVPSIQSFLADYAVLGTGRDDGSVKIQLDFLKLPKEIIPELEKLLSVHQFKDHRLVKYIKNGQARTGLEIEVTPRDLPGKPFDYAF